MGTGRDAADVALTTSFGRMDLVKFFVISDEVVPASGPLHPSLRERRRKQSIARCPRWMPRAWIASLRSQ